MSVDELNQNELEELRETLFDQLEGSASDVLGNYTKSSDIPISNVKEHYKEIYFVKEDFFCNI